MCEVDDVFTADKGFNCYVALTTAKGISVIIPHFK